MSPTQRTGGGFARGFAALDAWCGKFSGEFTNPWLIDNYSAIKKQDISLQRCKVHKFQWLKDVKSLKGCGGWHQFNPKVVRAQSATKMLLQLSKGEQPIKMLTLDIWESGHSCRLPLHGSIRFFTACWWLEMAETSAQKETPSRCVCASVRMFPRGPLDLTSVRASKMSNYPACWQVWVAWAPIQ